MYGINVHYDPGYFVSNNFVVYYKSSLCDESYNKISKMHRAGEY